MVNIAVFAAFYIVIGTAARANAAFKPVCRKWQRDIWRYEWQKRQDAARNGTVGGKNGTVLGRWRGVQGHAVAGAHG
ncbi:MAG TPA: hypothetical protein VLJ14_13710 [Ktedonobacterales bacterium]|nr:hypothetical protein [Ktedonobacterales bacterium]